MKVFITGTDTNVGKTLVSSWLCLHTSYAYFKPIQTGTNWGWDSNFVAEIANNLIYPAKYNYPEPLSPHLAAKLNQEIIELNKIKLPCNDNLIIEGAGGVMVPINAEFLMLDLIVMLDLPVILVCRASLGTINHTLLSLEALRSRNVRILGVIINDCDDSNCHISEFSNFSKEDKELKLQENLKAIEEYGKIKVLAVIPRLTVLDQQTLVKILLPEDLKRLLARAN